MFLIVLEQTATVPPPPPPPRLPASSSSAPIIILDSDSDSNNDDDGDDDNDNDNSPTIDLTRESPPVAPKEKVKREVVDLRNHHRFSPISTTPIPILPRRPLQIGTIVLQDPDSDTDDVVIISDRQNPQHSSHNSLPAIKREPFTDVSNSQRHPIQVIGDINIGTSYSSFEEGQKAVYDLEASRGHIWRIGQTKKVNDAPKRITLRCNHYYRHTPAHLHTIDPSDHREGKTIKTDCMAHVNLSRRVDGTWHVSMTDWKHNHPPQLPPNGSIPRPPTKHQRAVVAQFSGGSGNFTRSQLAKILSERFPDHPLEPRQVTNMLNECRREARAEVEALGGDAASVVESLARKAETEHGWKYAIRLNSDQVLVGIWWQSPVQAALTRRYGDVLINDDTYNRNQYGELQSCSFLLILL